MARAGSKNLELEMWSIVEAAVDTVSGLVEDLDADAMRLCMTLRTASNVVFRDLHERLAEDSGLSPAALNVLLVMTLDEELEFGQVTKFTNMPKATASKLVDTMVHSGLLARRTSASDRRVTLISVTDKGKEEFRRAFGSYNRRERFWADALEPEEQRQLGALLVKLVESRLHPIALDVSPIPEAPGP